MSSEACGTVKDYWVASVEIQTHGCICTAKCEINLKMGKKSKINHLNSINIKSSVYVSMVEVLLQLDIFK
jgi:hypothetical protein